MVNGSEQGGEWQQQLAQSRWELGDLLRYLRLPKAFIERQLAANLGSVDFPLRVTQSFADRIEKGNTADPLLRQILPSARELEFAPGFSDDPLQEKESNPCPGLIHKYRSRVLLTVTNSCAVHCRYCFRQHFPYDENNPGKNQWREAFDYIAQKPELNEVILSGGDPLAANDQYLQWLINSLSGIDHIQRLRIHTRLPVVLPARVNESLITVLAQWPRQKVIVLHCNHPNEIDAQVANAATMLRSAGVTLLNQSVLLAGINDDAATLAQLSERLFAIDVMPYYLHILDRVKGAAHFEVNRAEALAIHEQLKLRLAGFLVPRLVEELPGMGSKRDVVDIS